MVIRLTERFEVSEWIGPEYEFSFFLNPLITGGWGEAHRVEGKKKHNSGFIPVCLIQYTFCRLAVVIGNQHWFEREWQG